MSLRAVAYVSQAEGIAETDIDRILQDAAAYNRMAGVTGVLVFDGHRFLQYLEGPDDGVGSAYARVLNARSHHHVRELARGEVPTRQFPRWTMASSRIAPEVMTDIADVLWDGFIAEPPVDGHRRTGFARLLEVWTGTSGELEPTALSLGS
jgi:hypothetical protein